MSNPTVRSVAWVQDLGDGHGGIWQDGLALSGADEDRRQDAVARISRVTSSITPESHEGGVMSWVRRAVGRRTEVVVEMPRETLDALGRRTLLTIHVTAPREAEAARIVDAVKREVDAARARGIAVVDLGPGAERGLSDLVRAVQAPGCLAAPFTPRSIE